MSQFRNFVFIASLLGAVAGWSTLALAQAEGHPKKIGSWQFLNYTSTGHSTKGIVVCEISHTTSSGWTLLFAGKGHTLEPIVQHKDMWIPVPVGTLLTTTLDGDTFRMQVIWASRANGGIQLHPVDRAKYAKFTSARVITFKLPGVETVTFRPTGTAAAFAALNNCIP